MALHDAPTIHENEGFELVGYHDLDGRPGFKLALREQEGHWYLYTGHLWHRGWSVIDVTDPTTPELLTNLDGPEGTWTIQVQAADGLLVTGLEKPMPGWGVPEDARFQEGAIFWDISADPSHPRQLGSWRTGATGTHRNFYAGGRYALMTATRPDWVGHGLVILDVADPANPVEVGSWAWPDQLNDHGQGLQQAYLHGPAHVEGDRAYLPYGKVGLVILDISDLSTPRLISRLSFGDLGSVLGAHSAVPLAGRNLLVVNGEAIEESGGDALNYTFVVDISNETRPRIVSTMPMPIPSQRMPYANYYAKGGRFGPHNQHHFQGNPAHLEMSRHVVMTYFNAGLRLYDVADPLQPREIGHFVPADPTERRGALPHTLVTQFEDVIVDARGVIYCTDKNYGIFVLRSLEPLR